MSRARFLGMLSLLGLAIVSTAQAQVPSLSSRSGAAYTVYLDFAGFDYTGTWAGGTPGSTPAYGTASEVRDIWARTAEKYAAFNINVTTVDPAVTAGFLSTNYSGRQTYYDDQARMMHTVIGGDGSWFGGGGVSYVGVTQNLSS